MCREYYLHPRQNGIFYVQFRNPENRELMTARSTGETDRFKAEVKAELWKINGIPTGRKRKSRLLEEAAGIESVIKAIRRANLNPDDALRIVTTLKSMSLIDITAVKNTGRGAVPFVDFLKTFWDYDKSDYIRENLAHGEKFHRSHAHQCLKRVNSVLALFFGNKKLNCITTDDLRKLTRQLSDQGLATSTINQITLCARTPLRWAYEQKIILENPCVGLKKFSVTNKERGILTVAEAKAVLSVDWKDKRAFVASLIAATTGARQGECLALRKNDIGEDTLNLAHSYSPIDGLKLPKNNQKRIVPLLPEVRTAILDLLKDNPHDVENPFIFYSLLPDKPVVARVIWEGFKVAIEKANEIAKKTNEKKPDIKIDYKARNICFHSWRHFFCSNITQQIESEKVAKVSGHLSESIFKKYADHIEEKNIKEVGKAVAESLGTILEFQKAG